MFENKAPNFNKLENYGFVRTAGEWSYTVNILDGQFELRVAVTQDGGVKTALYDPATGDPYTLHLVADAGGAFVGEVRAAYLAALEEIEMQCFESGYAEDCARRVLAYARERYGNEPEFLWAKFPTDAILRRNDTHKWYAAFLGLSRRKLGMQSDETVTILDLRMKPEFAANIDGKRFFPGYHMNKKSWFTLCLDGSVAPEEIFGLLDESYALAK